VTFSLCSQLGLKQGRKFSIYQQHKHCLASKLKRNDITLCPLQGEYGRTDIRVLSCARHQQTIDLIRARNILRQIAAAMRSFRGLVDNQQNAVFNGRIHIHPKRSKNLGRAEPIKIFYMSRSALLILTRKTGNLADDVMPSQWCHSRQIGQ